MVTLQHWSRETEVSPVNQSLSRKYFKLDICVMNRTSLIKKHIEVVQGKKKKRIRTHKCHARILTQCLVFSRVKQRNVDLGKKR